MRKLTTTPVSSTQHFGQRADYGISATIQNMGVDLRSANILMSQLFLNRTYIHATFQQVRGKAMSQCVATGGLGDACLYLNML